GVSDDGPDVSLVARPNDRGRDDAEETRVRGVECAAQAVEEQFSFENASQVVAETVALGRVHGLTSSATVPCESALAGISPRLRVRADRMPGSARRGGVRRNDNRQRR